jgi:lipopolysaccharide/colanic/teichoic acid biosynthesis glycosyltransferase
MTKLRTLRVDADPYKLSPESDKELLATATGKSLRRHRIDELPQLFPVLTGRMSLVGPRPELPDVVATYRRLDRRRLLVKPGVTGLWQIAADRNVRVNHNIKYDLYYLRKASLWLDMKIVVMTIPFVLNPK